MSAAADLEQTRKNLVVASRILVHQNVLDSFGHASVRHPTRRDAFLLPWACSPGAVTEDDIIEFGNDGEPVSPEERPLYLERYLHAAVYEARPEVNAVLHAHTESLLPFTICGEPFRPVIQSVGDMGEHIPVWDIADRFGDETDLLIVNMEQGRDLAAKFEDNRLVLMRGHGFVSCDVGIYGLVRLAVFLPKNAATLLSALTLGRPIKPLSKGEVDARRRIDPNSPSMRRAWNYWAREAGCGHLLKP